MVYGCSHTPEQSSVLSGALRKGVPSPGVEERWYLDKMPQDGGAVGM